MTVFSLDGGLHFVSPDDAVRIPGPATSINNKDGSVYFKIGRDETMTLLFSAFEPGDVMLMEANGAITIFMRPHDESIRFRASDCNRTDQRLGETTPTRPCGPAR